MSNIYLLVRHIDAYFEGASDEPIAVTMNKIQLTYIISNLDKIPNSYNTYSIVEIFNYKPKNANSVLTLSSTYSDEFFYSSIIIKSFFEIEKSIKLIDNCININSENDNQVTKTILPINSSLNKSQMNEIYKCQDEEYINKFELINSKKKNKFISDYNVFKA
jgi:hypothetical protein